MDTGFTISKKTLRFIAIFFIKHTSSLIGSMAVNREGSRVVDNDAQWHRFKRQLLLAGEGLSENTIRKSTLAAKLFLKTPVQQNGSIKIHSRIRS